MEVIKFSEEKKQGRIEHLIPIYGGKMMCQKYFWQWSNEHCDWIRKRKIPKNKVK